MFFSKLGELRKKKTSNLFAKQNEDYYGGLRSILIEILAIDNLKVFIMDCFYITVTPGKTFCSHLNFGGSNFPRIKINSWKFI